MTAINNRKIIFTGGGSAGHVTPNLALIKKCKEQNWDVSYIGSKKGIERRLIKNTPFYSITTGKLRRYFSWHNFIDPFKIFFGTVEAFLLCRKIKPDVVFSKGGFVSFPVVIAAWLLKIPVIIHESDLTPGLANKLSFPFATKICVTFPETKKYLKNQSKTEITGTPIRQELFHGNIDNGLKLCGFTKGKPVILVYGGGLGSTAINGAVRNLLPRLLPNFQVVHVCGKNKIDASLNLSDYKQFEYLQHELPDIMACANLIVARSGANSLYEFLTLHKPHILIPLPKLASRGDQIVNAKHFAQLGFSQVIFQETLTADKLYEKIIWMFEHQQQVLEKLSEFKKQNSIELIYDILTQYV